MNRKFGRTKGGAAFEVAGTGAGSKAEELPPVCPVSNESKHRRDSKNGRIVKRNQGQAGRAKRARKEDVLRKLFGGHWLHAALPLAGDRLLFRGRARYGAPPEDCTPQVLQKEHSRAISNNSPHEKVTV